MTRYRLLTPGVNPMDEPERFKRGKLPVATILGGVLVLGLICAASVWSMYAAGWLGKKKLTTAQIAASASPTATQTATATATATPTASSSPTAECTDLNLCVPTRAAGDPGLVYIPTVSLARLTHAAPARTEESAPGAVIVVTRVVQGPGIPVEQTVIVPVVVTVVYTQTPYPTYTPAATQTPWIIILEITREVTQTPTATETPTPTPTATETPTPTATETVNPS